MMKMSKRMVAWTLLVVMLVALLGLGSFAQLTPRESALAAEGNYYASIDTSLRGDALRAEIADLITDTHHTNPSYSAGLASLFEKADINPDTGKVIQFYTGTETNGFTGNREHVWPKNAGKAFPEKSEAGSDGHHLRPCDNNLNSSRGSMSFGEVPQTSSNIVAENGSTSYGSTPDELCYKNSTYFYPAKGFRGQTARILMYVQTRWGDKYDLSFVLGAGNNKTIGDIETLMKWHLQEPPTAQEMFRNEKVAAYQGNRNPFIDHPEWAAMIYCYDGESYNDELLEVVRQYDNYGTEDIAIEGLSFSSTEVSMVVGQSSTLDLTITPAKANGTVEWSTSNSAVATVSNGRVSAVGMGEATITAKAAANANIKASITVKVKGVTSIALSGAPARTSYIEGDTFNPSGLSVTATYSDGSTAKVAVADCTWLDGTARTAQLKEGSTSVICQLGNVEAVYEGITVAKMQGGSITITRSSFASGSGYAWGTWTVEGISGHAFIYHGTTNSMQFNNSKTSYYLFNTTPLPGAITKVVVTLREDAESWELRTSPTAYSQMNGVPTTGTSHGKKAMATTPTEWVVSTSDRYFALCYADSGASYITSITIYYGEGCSHTASDWMPEVEPTCSSSGSQYKICTKCGTVLERETVAKLNHDYEEIAAVEPTCTTQGTSAYLECTLCGAHSGEPTVVPALGHTWSEWAEDTDGENEVRSCSVCGENQSRPIQGTVPPCAEHVDEDQDMLCDVCGAEVEIKEDPIPDGEWVDAFVAAVEAAKSASADELLTKIGEAAALYEELSADQKAEVATSFAELKTLAKDYNAEVDAINTTHQQASGGALSLFAGFGVLLALAALLKKLA